MRKVIVVVGLISIVFLWSKLSGSGLSLPGTASSSITPATPVAMATPNAAMNPNAAMTPNVVATSNSVLPTAVGTPLASPSTSTTITTSQIVTTTGPLVLLNPSKARPGSTVGVTGSGFEPGSTIDLFLKHQQSDAGKNLGFVQADKGGSFGGFNLTLPTDFASGPFIIVATQHDGKKASYAIGTVAANSPTVTFGTTVGKVGDAVTFTLKGFAPNEVVSIYFNSLTSPPVGTVTTDPSGGAPRQTIKVPYGAVGNNAFIFVGKTSQSPVTVSYTLLNLYPSLIVNTYATKADTTVSFGGKGFGPNERVFIHVNSITAPPIGIAMADATGSFKNGGQFTIPFALHGKTNIIAVGEQSQAPVSISIDVLPYTPSAETSTYGGRPGTTVTFYGNGFARGELVHVYVGRTVQRAGNEVSCFMSDPQGAFSAGGSYTLQSGTSPGTLVFTLVGDKSKVPASAKMQVMGTTPGEPAPPAVKTAPFHCDLLASTAVAPLPTPTPVTAAPPATPVDAGNGGGEGNGG
jgi:hypothetical protein